MIEVSHLSKLYGNFPAVRDLSFRVRPGEILGFLGPNGAGKTTTMRILAGYMPPSGGTCRIGGKDVMDHPLTVKRRIGYLPEQVPLYPELTVEEYLGFIARVRAIPAGERGGALDRIAVRCGLKDVRKKLIGRLSKGYRQRVGIAQALIHSPDVIILDEPTIGLDPAQIREVRELIRSLGEDHTIILSTHILPEVSQICQRVLIINHGRIIAEDTPENLTGRITKRLVCDSLVQGDRDRLAEVLAAAENLPEWEITAAEEPGMWHCTLVLSDGEQRPRLLAALQNGGLAVYEFHRRRVSLEDVFLQLIMEENDGLAAGASGAEMYAADAPDLVADHGDGP
ncbi:MAG: ABC transporter ATP-binding protein [Acidobacteria bacterium]|nr:ABC transporter ATP-binding protein [Acidobacteriota bacterium]